MKVVPLRAVPDDEAVPAWFAALGGVPTPAEREDLAVYAQALGVPADEPLVQVEDWSAASALTRAPGGDMAWWQREEAERLRLAQQVGDADAVLRALTRATDAIADAVFAAASAAAARQGCGDAFIIRVAAGAAMQATHHRALAHMAGEPGHFFTHKYRLFAGGRWPLGVYNGRFHLF